MSKQTPEQRAKQIYLELWFRYEGLTEQAKALGLYRVLFGNPEVEATLVNWLERIEDIKIQLTNLESSIAMAQPEAIMKRIEWIATTMQLKCRKP